jgi:hypothetical protein
MAERIREVMKRIVSQRDVAMHASEEQTGEVVEDISR